MKYSVVIPLYNKENYIIETINSVLNQSTGDFEIIVINDGSSDKSVEKVNELSDLRIKLFNQPNSGVSSARNNGIMRAQGDYLIFLDADDQLLPNALAIYDDLLNRYPSTVFFCANYLRVKNNKSNESIKVDKILGQNFTDGIIENFFYIASYRPGSFPCCVTSFTVKREFVINENILFPYGVTHTEDISFCCELALKTPIVFTRKCVSKYFIEAENNSRMFRPTETRYIIDLLRQWIGRYNNIKNIDSFLTKNLVHISYNCIEFNDEENFKKHTNDDYFRIKYAIGIYKLHVFVLKTLNFKLLKKIYSFLRK